MKGKRSIRRFLRVPERGLDGLNYAVAAEIKKKKMDLRYILGNQFTGLMIDSIWED